MHLPSLIASALIGQVAAKKVIRPCVQDAAPRFGTMPSIQPLDVFTGMFNGQAQHFSAERGNNDAFAAFASQNNQCLDVAGGLKSNAPVQTWQCHGGDNQKWRFEGALVQTGQNLCLDVPSGKGKLGSTLQVYKCDASNPNQMFEQVGSNIRWKGHDLCLDVKDGKFANGTPIQFWSCYLGSPHQKFNKQATAPTPASNGASNFLGYTAISIDKFGQLHPECAPWIGVMKSAAQANHLHPTLLGAVAEVESSCSERPASNRFGLFQFMDDNAFRVFGGAGADRQKGSDATWAAARYLRTLLDENGQNLDRALRAYNGPVNQGGDPNYAKLVATWMSGKSTW